MPSIQEALRFDPQYHVNPPWWYAPVIPELRCRGKRIRSSKAIFTEASLGCIRCYLGKERKKKKRRLPKSPGRPKDHPPAEEASAVRLIQLVFPFSQAFLFREAQHRDMGKLTNPP